MSFYLRPVDRLSHYAHSMVNVGQHYTGNITTFLITDKMIKENVIPTKKSSIFDNWQVWFPDKVSFALQKHLRVTFNELTLKFFRLANWKLAWINCRIVVMIIGETDTAWCQHQFWQWYIIAPMWTADLSFQIDSIHSPTLFIIQNTIDIVLQVSFNGLGSPLNTLLWNTLLRPIGRQSSARDSFVYKICQPRP